jgi:hypothetical protein
MSQGTAFVEPPLWDPRSISYSSFARRSDQLFSSPNSAYPVELAHRVILPNHRERLEKPRSLFEAKVGAVDYVTPASGA